MTKAKSAAHAKKAGALDPAAIRKKNLAALAKKAFTASPSLPLWDKTTLRPAKEIAARLTALRLLFLWAATSHELA